MNRIVTRLSMAAAASGALLFPPAASADSPAAWVISYPAGGTDDTARISKAKTTLTGTFAGSLGGGATCSGALRGNQGRAGAVTFTVTFDAPCSGTAVYTGSIEDDSSAAGSSCQRRPNPEQVSAAEI